MKSSMKVWNTNLTDHKDEVMENSKDLKIIRG